MNNFHIISKTAFNFFFFKIMRNKTNFFFNETSHKYIIQILLLQQEASTYNCRSNVSLCKASSSSLLPLLSYIIHILTICDFYIPNIEKKSSYDDSELKCIDNFSFMEAYLQLKRQHNLLCTQELSSLRVPCTCAMRVNCMQEFTRRNLLC